MLNALLSGSKPRLRGLLFFYFTYLPLCLPTYTNANIIIAEAPVIFNSTETAAGGEVFGVQGFNFGTKPELWYARVTGNTKLLEPVAKLKIVSQSDRNVSALIPNEPSFTVSTLIAVWIKNTNTGKFSVHPVFLNKARAVTIEYDQIMAGQTFRIFGRNLKVPIFSPRVSFIEEGVKNAFAAKVLPGGDEYVLSIQAPNQIKAGKRYKIKVSNGNDGAIFSSASSQSTAKLWPLSETESEEFITGIATAEDPFNLKVPWGTEFTFSKNIYNVKTDARLVLKAKGDGETDDRKAIQDAVDLASKNGGGVVYFPAGKYKLDIPSGSGIVMKSRVVLKGDGLDKTFIQYGFGTPPPYPNPIGKDGWPNATTEGVAILWPLKTTLTGLYSLCLQNVNTSGIWRHSLKTLAPPVKEPGASGSKYFAANCRFDFAVAWGLSWGYVDRMMITDCIFDSKSQVTWPWVWHCNGSTNFVVRNNRVHYAAGRFGFNDSYNGIIENNHITRLGDIPNYKGETGGFNVDYAQDIVVLGNRLDVEGKKIENYNQGETILSQGGNPDQMDVGTVTLATATSVTDKSKKWGLIRTSSLSSADHIAIIDGRGAGQWRRIKSNTENTVQIEKAWDVIPDKTSNYAIMRWSADDWLVKDNILEDNNRGIWFYCGSTDVAIVNNKLTNSEGIYIRADQRLALNRYNLSWNVLVADNKVVNTNGFRPAFVCNIVALGTKPDSLIGLGCIGIEIRRNFVQASTPNVGTFVRGEGYFNEVLFKNPTYPSKGLANGTTGIIGTIFENNKVVNADIGYRLYTSIDQTIIKGAVFENVKTPITEAKGTVIVEDK